AADRKELSAIVGAEERQPAEIVGQRAVVARLPPCRLLECRRGVVPGGAGRERGEEVEVRRLPMVVSRELRVPALAVDLTVDFIEQDPASERDAAIARAQFGQGTPGDVER